MTTNSTPAVAGEEEPMTGWAAISKALERYGFAVVACCGIAWFANTAIEYERTKMLPAIEDNTKAIERNTEVFRTLPEVWRKERKAQADEEKAAK